MQGQSVVYVSKSTWELRLWEFVMDKVIHLSFTPLMQSLSTDRADTKSISTCKDKSSVKGETGPVTSV